MELSPTRSHLYRGLSYPDIDKLFTRAPHKIQIEIGWAVYEKYVRIKDLLFPIGIESLKWMVENGLIDSWHHIIDKAVIVAAPT